MKLTPTQLYSMRCADFIDMIIAYRRREEELFDENMKTLAWQTANLINGISHRKKPIKVTDIYKGIKKDNEPVKNQEKDIDTMKQELKERFGL